MWAPMQREFFNIQEYILQGCNRRAYSMYKASVNLLSLEARPGLIHMMWNWAHKSGPEPWMTNFNGQFTGWVNFSNILKSESSCTLFKPRACFQWWTQRPLPQMGDIEWIFHFYAVRDSLKVPHRSETGD